MVVFILLVNELSDAVDVSKESNLPSLDDVNVFKSPSNTRLSSLPLIPPFHLFSVPSHIKEPDNIPGDVASLTSIPPLAAPLPFNEITLSETSTVVELTLVSVPLTNKLPFIVTLEPVSSIAVSISSLKSTKSPTFMSFDDVYVFNADLTEPLSVSKELTCPSNVDKSLSIK